MTSPNPMRDSTPVRRGLTALLAVGLVAVFGGADMVSPAEHAVAQDSRRGGIDVRGAGAAGGAVERSDREALTVLNRAIERQGGAALAAQGALRSFRLEFGRVIVQRRIEQEDGTVVYGSDEAERLDIDWMRNENAEPSLKTQWELNGRVTTRAVFGPRKPTTGCTTARRSRPSTTRPTLTTSPRSSSTDGWHAHADRRRTARRS